MADVEESYTPPDPDPSLPISVHIDGCDELACVIRNSSQVVADLVVKVPYNVPSLEVDGGFLLPEEGNNMFEDGGVYMDSGNLCDSVASGCPLIEGEVVNVTVEFNVNIRQGRGYSNRILELAAGYNQKAFEIFCFTTNITLIF